MQGFKNLVRALLFLFIGAVFMLLPGAIRLPVYRRTSLDGVVTIEDAVAACRQTGLTGWALVAFAQQLVARKFAIYTTRNLWDSPARAFAHGMGYCTQYNSALKLILDALGFTSEAVYALRVQVGDDPRWRMGHTWLRVKVNEEVREVCAGNVKNSPGKINFHPLSRVLHGTNIIFFTLQAGMIPYCGFIEWAALLSRRDPPYWTYYEK